MKLLAIEKDTENVSGKDIQSVLTAEAKSVWDLYQLGIIREIYFRQDSPNAVLILECNDKSEARLILDRLPLVKEGLISFDIIPLKPYPGFSRLFSEVKLSR